MWPDDRPETYDADLYWDEENGVWGSSYILGGGRYTQQLITIGTDDNNEGIIYFGSI